MLVYNKLHVAAASKVDCPTNYLAPELQPEEGLPSLNLSLPVFAL